MIEVSNLSFSYGKKSVLDSVSFSLEPGKLTAVLGKNGAGKSTLFRCILGLLTGYAGSIKVEGREVKGLSVQQLAHRVAYIPQTHYPSFNYSVQDMVLMGTAHRLSPFSAPKAEQEEDARQALELLDISHLALRSYTHLSGGEQQLVLIARALAQGCPMLLMDEPTASLDYGNQLLVMKQVRELASRGYTILMSSHNPQHVLSFAHQVIALKDGAVLCSDQPEQVMDAKLMDALYGVSTAFISTEKGKVIVPQWEE